MELFGYAFMQRALIASVLIGTVTAVIGVYVVLRGLAFIGAGIAHASFGGVALGFVLGIDPVLAAVIFCLATAWGIAWTASWSAVREDTAIGIFFAASMALGILLIGFVREYHVDLFAYLFGSVLSVTPADLLLTALLAVVVLGTVALFFKEFLFLSFDAEMAEASGLPVSALHFLLLSILALAIVVSIKVVGIILVSAMIIAPAAAAYQLTDDFRAMMLLAVLLGNAAAIGGLLLSYALDTASGATMVLAATAIFFASAALSPRRRSAKRS